MTQGLFEILLFRLISFLIFLPSPVNAFVVSVDDCEINSSSANRVYEFNFGHYETDPDISIQVSWSSLSDDLTIAITKEPSLANLIIADKIENADISICRTNPTTPSLYGGTKIEVKSFLYSPDVRVGITSYTSRAKYILFNASQKLSDEEAAAFFAVLWKRGGDQEQKTITAYQLQFRRDGQWLGGPVFARAWDCSDAQWAPGVIGARCVEVQVPAQ